MTTKRATSRYHGSVVRTIFASSVGIAAFSMSVTEVMHPNLAPSFFVMRVALTRSDSNVSSECGTGSANGSIFLLPVARNQTILADDNDPIRYPATEQITEVRRG